MRKGLLLVALAALSWGTTGTTLKLVGAASPTDALLVGAVRMAVAGPLLSTAVLVRRTTFGATRGEQGRAPLPVSSETTSRGLGHRITRDPGRTAGVWAWLLGGICIAVYQVCYFSAVPLAGVAATALLAICSAPILVTILAHFTLGEAAGGATLASLALGVGGAGLLLAGAGGEVGSNFGLGAVLALGAGLAYSMYAVVTKHSLSNSEPLALAALTFMVAAATLAPLLALRWTDTLSLLARGGLQLLYLGAVATAGAYWLYTTALKSIPASAAVVAGLLEPLTATVLGVVLFHEHLRAVGYFGAALLLAGVVVLGLAASGGRTKASAGHIPACSR